MKILIAIDPDCDKSGVALKVKSSGKINVDVMTFFELFEYLFLELKPNILNDYFVYIEAGWLNHKSNYHKYANQSKEVGEMIAKKVGANHETGRKIAEMCEFLKLPYELVKPASKKVTPAYFKLLTGIECKGKYKQEMIDAGMLLVGR